MEQIEKCYPIGDTIAPISKDNIVSLVIAIVIYLVVGAVFGVLIGVLASIPIVGIIFGIVGALVGLYCLGGIILSVVRFIK